MFNASTFTSVEAKPELIGGLGQGGLVDEFVAKFGSQWKRTPKKGVWFIGCNGTQITMVVDAKYGMDFAYYDYATVSEFRLAFESGAHAFNAQYFQLLGTEVQYKYPALRIIAFLKERGLWV